MGRQALYRGQYPTLRGQFTVTGHDGWRAGQLVKVTDSRLPSPLNGAYYVIQRVSGTLIAAQDMRRYTIDFGDGPKSRYTGQRPPQPVKWPSPAAYIDIKVYDLSPGPNSSQRITAQLVANDGTPWEIAGKSINWRLECYTSPAGVLQPNTGELDPTVSVTDRHGRAYTTFTSADRDDELVYFIFANTKAT
jgi:hypothetical protein